MKIADLEEKENDKSIYQLILEANRIDENCIVMNLHKANHMSVF